MHVVQALASLTLGGSEFVATEVAEFLRGQNHRVTVIAAGGPLAERVRACGADHVEWTLGIKRLRTLRYVARLADWLKREQPDILHVHSRFPAWICWLALRRVPADRRPVLVTTMHGHYSVNRYSSIMARGRKIVAVSEHIRAYTLENYPAVRPDDVVTIYNGASPSQFPYGYRPTEAWRHRIEREFPALAGKRWLLLPGRISRRKGHAGLLHLMAALREDHPGLHAVFVGDSRPGSRYPSELQGLARKLSLHGHCTLVGGRLDMRDWMGRSEIVFNLTGYPPEAFGRTVLEALKLGKPVLAWDHGGPAEILAGLYPAGAVEPGDTDGLEACCREFLEAPPSVEPSEAFSLEDSMRRHLRLYEMLLSA
ncbi:MAG: glycosyltransferase [Lysobacterales bacterium]|jgi:glycosyltransferase involved in cell wall biosynthesis